jgi:succinyl-CoA synthetase beta subunit
VAAAIIKLWDDFKKEDATLVEVNPLVRTGAGDKMVATVQFSIGEKRLLLRYAPLTKVEA